MLEQPIVPHHKGQNVGCGDLVLGYDTQSPQDVLTYQVLEILVERAKEIWPGQALFGRTKCNPIVPSGNRWGTNYHI